MNTKKLVLGVCVLAAFTGAPKVFGAQFLVSPRENLAEETAPVIRTSFARDSHYRLRDTALAKMDRIRNIVSAIMTPLASAVYEASQKLDNAIEILKAAEAKGTISKFIAERNVENCKRRLARAAYKERRGCARANELNDIYRRYEAFAKEEEEIAERLKTACVDAYYALETAEQRRRAGWEHRKNDEKAMIEAVKSAPPSPVIAELELELERDRGQNRHNPKYTVAVIEAIKTDYYAKVDVLRRIEEEAGLVKTIAVENVKRQVAAVPGDHTRDFETIRDACNREIAAKKARLEVVHQTFEAINAACQRFYDYNHAAPYSFDRTICVSTSEKEVLRPEDFLLYDDVDEVDLSDDDA
jgi:hypothetical protein